MLQVLSLRRRRLVVLRTLLVLSLRAAFEDLGALAVLGALPTDEAAFGGLGVPTGNGLWEDLDVVLSGVGRDVTLIQLRLSRVLTRPLTWGLSGVPAMDSCSEARSLNCSSSVASAVGAEGENGKSNCESIPTGAVLGTQSNLGKESGTGSSAPGIAPRISSTSSMGPASISGGLFFNFLLLPLFNVNVDFLCFLAR